MSKFKEGDILIDVIENRIIDILLVKKVVKENDIYICKEIFYVSRSKNKKYLHLSMNYLDNNYKCMGNNIKFVELLYV